MSDEQILGVFVGTRRGAKKYMLLHGVASNIVWITLNTARMLGDATPMRVRPGTFMHVSAYSQKGLIFTSWRYVVVRGRL